MKNQEQVFYMKDQGDKLKAELSIPSLVHSMLGATPLALNVWNKDMVNIMCNRKVLDIFGMESGEEYLEKFYEFSPQFQPDGQASIEKSKEMFRKVLENEEVKFHWMHQTLNGEEVPSEIILRKLIDKDLNEYIIGFVRDMRSDFVPNVNSDYDFFFRDKIPQHLLLDEMAKLSDEWFFSMDIRTGKFHYYGKFWDENLGAAYLLEPEKVIDLGFVHPEDIDLYLEVMNNLKAGKVNDFDIRFLSDDQSYHYYKVVSKVILGKEGEPVFVVGKGSDIHEQKVFEERSQKDLLTNCYNKISGEHLIAEKLKMNKDGIHAFFIIDIDNFKGVNDNLGHYFGDEVLREIAAGLKSVFREVDIVARIGGDEFIVFVENMSNIELVKNKAEIILEVYKKTYSGEFKDYSISGSVGVALFPRDGYDYDSLYQNADKALSQAKIQGKNRYILYSSDLRVGTTRNVTKIENANRIASSFFDYDLISAVFNILYEHNGDNESIDLAMRYLCEKYGADRSYIFESLDEGKQYSNTFEYCKEGISSEIDSLKNVPGELFVDFVEKAHNNIIYSNDLRDTFEVDEAFELMARQGILSFIHAQVKRDGIMNFFIGLDDCTKTRVWSEREINSLQYIGKMISIILQGTHSREEADDLAERNRNSAHILNSLDDIVYVSDVDSYELLFLNEAGIKAVGNLKEEEWKSKKCYEILQGKSDPCDFCTNHLLSSEQYYEWSYYNPVLEASFLLKDTLIPFNGKLARLEIATDISKVVTLEQELKDRLEDEYFLTSCVEMFHTGNDPNESIQGLLESITQYFDCERTYIFERSGCGKYVSNTFEHCAKEIDAYKNEMQNLPIEEFGFLMKGCEEMQAFHLDFDKISIKEDSLEYRLMKSQNLEDIIISPIRLQEGDVSGFVGLDNPKKNKDKVPIIRSIAKFTASFLDETKAIEKLNKLSYYDILTGIKNRHSYNLAIKDFDTKDIKSLGVAYVDVVGLSQINDSKGITYGDEVLKRLANLLYQIFGSSVFRVGGDEFVVLSENVCEVDFESGIERVKQVLRDEHDFEVSIGYTWNQNIDKTGARIGDLREGEKYSRILSDNLDAEIRDEKYIVYLQPQVDLSSKEVHSAEALIRKVTASGRIQPPIAFIPFYEKEGIISKLDLFVFETICKTLRDWKLEGGKSIETVAINCSRMTIANREIVNQFINICEHYGIKTSQIMIEITETIHGISEQALTQIIQRFSDAGFLVSLDDFGSGYSNLNSLAASDFDELKIDMKLTNDLHRSKKARVLTELAISLCNKLGNLVSVAEGVEVKEQYELLKEMGCSKGQGYYFSKPMPLEEFAKQYIFNENA